MDPNEVSSGDVLEELIQRGIITREVVQLAADRIAQEQQMLALNRALEKSKADKTGDKHGKS